MFDVDPDEFVFGNDFVQNENDYLQKTYCLQFENRTTYFGYEIWASTGIQFEEKDFREETREFESY